MSIEKLYHQCKLCAGTGTEDFVTMEGGEIVPGSRTCLLCSGEGKHSNTRLSPDLITLLQDMNDKINDMNDKINDMNDKINDIFEKVNE